MSPSQTTRWHCSTNISQENYTALPSIVPIKIYQAVNIIIIFLILISTLKFWLNCAKWLHIYNYVLQTQCTENKAKSISIYHWIALVAEFSIVSLTTFIFLSSLPLFLFLALLMLRSFICWTDLVSYHSPLWTNAIFCKDIYSILYPTICFGEFNNTSRILYCLIPC